jgi:type IV pilus assembly protein PilC
MSSFSYVAFDCRGAEAQGIIEVADQSEALRRLKEMGLFPARVCQTPPSRGRPGVNRVRPRLAGAAAARPALVRRGRVKPAQLAIFTRQLATLVEAGMPLLRSLRILRDQEASPSLKRVIGEVSTAIEEGNSLAESISAHPRVFNRLYISMVQAGEIAGALELTLRRLAEFMEKAERIKSKVKAALFYPAAVLSVAAGILTLLMVWVVPRFRLVFDGLTGGQKLPAFTRLVFELSETLAHHWLLIAGLFAGVGIGWVLAARTTAGKWVLDHLKLVLPVLGPLFHKAAISRFARTLGTLLSSGVPVLQALTIVRDTTGNCVFSRLVGRLHESVKEGDPIAPTLKGSRLFPAMVSGMVDVGEQTGALPDLLIRIADTFDGEVDNAACALTSILEPVLIVILAVVVGGIVIAMFLPLVQLMGTDFGSSSSTQPPE